MVSSRNGTQLNAVTVCFRAAEEVHLNVPHLPDHMSPRLTGATEEPKHGVRSTFA
jgi:hypothetical protein